MKPLSKEILSVLICSIEENSASISARKKIIQPGYRPRPLAERNLFDCVFLPLAGNHWRRRLTAIIFRSSHIEGIDN